MRRFNKILKIIPVSIFIIGRYIFDASPSLSDYAQIILISDSPIITNWQVFYFVMLDVSWLTYLMALRYNEFNDDYILFYYTLGFSFIVDIIINLMKINLNFTDYIVSISSIEQNILISGMMSAILIVFLIKILNSSGWSQMITRLLTYLRLLK